MRSVMPSQRSLCNFLTDTHVILRKAEVNLVWPSAVGTMGEVKTFLILLRGTNVGGKNKVSMAELKKCLEGLGFFDVSTFIVSGNVVLTSDRNAGEVAAKIETALPKAFKLDSELIRALVLTRDQLRDRKSTRLNSSHLVISYAVFC